MAIAIRAQQTAMSTSPKTAPYGSWKSPITSDLIVSQSVGLSEVRFDGDVVYWLEARPQEQGRNVVVRAGEAGADATDIVPKPFNVRTRVHEYGGGAWTVAQGVLYFSNVADGRLYRLGPGEREPTPLTPAPPAPDRQWRFADGIIDLRRKRWIGVREDHTVDGHPVNAIVAIDLAQPGTSPGAILADGHDFVASPRLSPDGRRLAWLAWDHPNMPWNGTTLYLAELGDDGAIVGAPRAIAGGPTESISSPSGRPMALTSFSSRIVRAGGISIASTLATGAVPRSRPWRRSSASRNGFSAWRLMPSPSRDRIVCAYAEAGLGHSAVVDLATGALRPLDTPFTQFASVRAHGDQAAFIAGAPAHPTSVVVIDLAFGRYRILKKATEILDAGRSRIADYLTPVEAIEFPTSGGRTAYGLFYRPHNPD